MQKQRFCCALVTSKTRLKRAEAQAQPTGVVMHKLWARQLYRELGCAEKPLAKILKKPQRAGL
ncbi:Putative hypothetical protein [Helicobacter mustelae 12198]|uniref:Uncharacterized protein n=1 Tax=Helicobacter mustelae (strain ATCC 43772 / CCUG 25715 / CIP 103759 / LMG 18044 / NCTC 12198 / R85-136P) TaxID=679897 RepID=D3UJK3_HELM1|nr:Putative hypothetical protein [Helicobacter mustelae 12198]